MRKKPLNSKGFTILEMLIAVTVFSIMLLLVGGVITQLSKQFYKGLVKSRTQEAARRISEEIVTNIQFSGSDPYRLATNGLTQGWCIADRRYMFVEDRQLGDGGGDQAPGVLMRDEACTETPLPDPLGPPTDASINRVELIGEHMRLATFSIIPSDDDKVWDITVRVVYGDWDLLCSPTEGDCNASGLTPHLDKSDLSCKNQTGSQYCAVAEYRATVARRL